MVGFKNQSKDVPIALEVLEREYCRLTKQPYPIPEMIFARSWMLFRVSGSSSPHITRRFDSDHLVICSWPSFLRVLLLGTHDDKLVPRKHLYMYSCSLSLESLHVSHLRRVGTGWKLTFQRQNCSCIVWCESIFSPNSLDL